MDTSLKRIIAYLIDILIVSIVVTPFINLKAINPYIDDYNKYYEEYTKLIEDANNGDIAIIKGGKKYSLFHSNED